MPDFAKCDLRLQLEFGSVRDRVMTVEIEYADQRTQIRPGPDLTAMHDIEIRLPTKVLLHFSGKQDGLDTIVDLDGNIVQDMYVKITGMELDGFAVNQKGLYQRFTLETNQGQSITTCYAGFNGTMTLDFDKPDVFAQYLWLNQ